MNRSFTIDVRGFADKAEAALERMFAGFAATLPAQLNMNSAVLVPAKKPPAPKAKAKAKPAPPRPNARIAARNAAKKGKK